MLHSSREATLAYVCYGDARHPSSRSLMNPSAELEAALEAAARAADIARSLYLRNIDVRIKADRTPVTEADVRCEMAIRQVLEARFPAHGFFGEETEPRDLSAESVWLVDPIDGTKAFVREYPDRK